MQRAAMFAAVLRSPADSASALQPGHVSAATSGMVLRLGSEARDCEARRQSSLEVFGCAWFMLFAWAKVFGMRSDRSMWLGVCFVACASPAPAATTGATSAPTPAQSDAGRRNPDAGGATLDAGARAASAPPGAAGTPAAVSGKAPMRPPSAGRPSVAGTGGAMSNAGSSAAIGGAAGLSMSAFSPVYRVPLRVHIGESKLSDADLGPIFDELNRIWLEQAGICFEIEVTSADTNRSDGFDFRYTSGSIPGASGANGLTQNAHAIWSIDHPQLGSAPHPVMNPTARTTAHELGHALGLAHENPPPSSDCSDPCYCVERMDNCDDYLLRSGTKGFFVSPPEVQITRKNALKVALSDQSPVQCSAPTSDR
jgi:hypothetical protein